MASKMLPSQMIVYQLAKARQAETHGPGRLTHLRMHLSHSA
jgi:hypothetical protein